jgi:hypothetical protein
VLFFVLARELVSFGARKGFMVLFGAPNWEHSKGFICALYYINYIFKVQQQHSSTPLSHQRLRFARPLRVSLLGCVLFLLVLRFRLLQYIELADTMFLCLRKKSTPFIHVYHHAITLMLCWTQLTASTCMQWVSSARAAKVPASRT